MSCSNIFRPGPGAGHGQGRHVRGRRQNSNKAGQQRPEFDDARVDPRTFHENGEAPSRPRRDGVPTRLQRQKNHVYLPVCVRKRKFNEISIQPFVTTTDNIDKSISLLLTSYFNLSCFSYFNLFYFSYLNSEVNVTFPLLRSF